MTFPVPLKNKQFFPRMLLGAALLFFVIFTVRNLNVCFPFLVEDEYFKFQVAEKILRIFQGLADRADILTVPAHPGAPFLMYHDYVGWPVLYFAVALMSVLGNVLGQFFVFKFSVVVLGLLTLWSMWLVLRNWFCAWTAGLAVFFTACNFSYIQSVQYGFFREEVFQICGLWSGFALCLAGRRRKNSFLFYSGLFVFGLTLWAKIMFAAYIIAATVVFLVFGRRRWEGVKEIFPDGRNILFACLAFVCGMVPFLWFNFCNGFPTVRMLAARVFNFSEVNGGWDNSAVGANLLRRVHDFYLYMSGQVLFELNTYAFVFSALLFCSLIWVIVVLSGLSKDAKLKLRVRILFVFYLVVFFLTCFLPLRHASGHILILVPFAEILCALFLVDVGRMKNMLFLPVLICGLWFCEQLNHMSVFSRHYIKSGQLYGLMKGECGILTDWIGSKEIKTLLCSTPVARVINAIDKKSGLEFYDVGHIYVGSEAIAKDIRLFISESMGRSAYMLICSGEDSATYKKIKDSAEEYGIKVEVVDSKLLRNNPACNFLFCRMTLPEPGKTILSVS